MSTSGVKLLQILMGLSGLGIAGAVLEAAVPLAFAHLGPVSTQPTPTGPLRHMTHPVIQHAEDGDATLEPRAVASYALVAELDAVRHVVQCHGTIRWINTSRVAVDELWLHLYLNAFSHPRTLFLRASGGRHEGVPAAFGGITIRRLMARELENIDLWPTADPHSPGDPEDATDIRVPLTRSLGPGERLTLEIEFEARLPRLFERTGYVDSFHLVAQWFPKLARLEEDGTFAHFAFHPQAEFYADFGEYDVTLDVPATMTIGATGQRVEEQESGGRRRLRYRASNVHDFAWTAWDAFREVREDIAGVDVRILYPRGHAANAKRALDTIRFALPDMSRRYGAYPYSTLTVVHPPPHAGEAGGMEYPTFITTGAPWFAPLISRGIEVVTVHELAHQWFYGLVATNEQALPVLDEGLATWAESLTMDRLFGNSSAIFLPGLEVSAESLRRAHAASQAHDDVVVQPAASFTDFASIGALVYSKTGTTLRTLANVYGEDRVESAVGSYARRYRFRHPDWHEFCAVFREYVGPEATETLRLALETRGWVNYSARAPECRAEPTGAEGGAVQRCSALVKRHGTLTLPVEIEVVLADGSRITEEWDGRDEIHRLERDGPERMVAVVVDPRQRILLDTNLLDNAASAEPRTTTRITEHGAFLVAALLDWVGP